MTIISTYIEEIEELFEGGRGWGTLNGRVGSVGENQNSKHTDRETHAHFLPLRRMDLLPGTTPGVGFRSDG